jgi:adenosylmethionine-8-amino-7-oxononanoate aminotransferase
LRPLGDTMYFFPPLNTDDETLDKMTDIAVAALSETIGK